MWPRSPGQDKRVPLTDALAQAALVAPTVRLPTVQGTLTSTAPLLTHVWRLMLHRPTGARSSAP